jgi:hypothetical protein
MSQALGKTIETVEGASRDSPFHQTSCRPAHRLGGHQHSIRGENEDDFYFSDESDYVPRAPGARSGRFDARSRRSSKRHNVLTDYTEDPTDEDLPEGMY